MKTSEITSAKLNVKQSQVFNGWSGKAVNATTIDHSIPAKRTLATLFDKHALWFEEARFPLMTLMMTLQSCIGSIACMYIFQNNASDIMFIICAVITMAANAMFISQAPAKICLVAFYISLIGNTAFILMNL